MLTSISRAIASAVPWVDLIPCILIGAPCKFEFNHVEANLGGFGASLGAASGYTVEVYASSSNGEWRFIEELLSNIGIHGNVSRLLSLVIDTHCNVALGLC